MATRDSEVDAGALIDGCAHVETAAELAQRIARGTPLRVKFGVDPTGSELHLGHAVVLHKMQEFVAAGHDVTLLIGDFTALIGDPSGRNDSRPHLTPEAIADNMRTYAQQAGLVLDLERVTIRYNSEWLGRLQLADLIRLMAQTTVAKMLAREDFRKRYSGATPIALHEFLYPVAQAYDSVALGCDVELGGDDQLFNFLLARDYQVNAGQLPQICMTLPILEGTDGVLRMGKSKGNYIGLTEPPREAFRKVMGIPDALIGRWSRLADFRSQDECAALERGIADGSRVAMNEKKQLAQAIVRRYHGTVAALDAREYFERTVQRGERPDDVAVIELAPAVKLVEALVAADLAHSKRAAQRLIGEGAVRLDGIVVSERAAQLPLAGAVMLSVGAHKHIRITLNGHDSATDTNVER